MKMLQSISTRIKRALARIPSPAVTCNIFRNTRMTENGDLMFQGKKIGHYDTETCVGWCSLIGYIRIMRAAKRAAK